MNDTEIMDGIMHISLNRDSVLGGKSSKISRAWIGKIIFEQSAFAPLDFNTVNY